MDANECRPMLIARPTTATGVEWRRSRGSATVTTTTRRPPVESWETQRWPVAGIISARQDRWSYLFNMNGIDWNEPLRDTMNRVGSDAASYGPSLTRHSRLASTMNSIQLKESLPDAIIWWLSEAASLLIKWALLSPLPLPSCAIWIFHLVFGLLLSSSYSRAWIKANVSVRFRTIFCCEKVTYFMELGFMGTRIEFFNSPSLTLRLTKSYPISSRPLGKV